MAVYDVISVIQLSVGGATSVFNATAIVSRPQLSIGIDSTVVYEKSDNQLSGVRAYAPNYSARLPTYLADTPAWSQLAEAMDVVLGTYLVDPAQQLANIRDVNNWHPLELQDRRGELLLDGSCRSYLDHEWGATKWRVQSAMMLGFNFYNLYHLDRDTHDAFVKQSVLFYPEQGTNSWVEFLGFATNSIIDVTPLWTLDYYNFVPEGDPLIGIPIWEEDGSWYPTSHVNIRVTVNFSSKIALPDFINLLYFAAPINLVINAIEMVYANTVVEPLYCQVAGTMSVNWL